MLNSEMESQTSRLPSFPEGTYLMPSLRTLTLTGTLEKASNAAYCGEDLLECLLRLAGKRSFGTK